MTNLQRCIAENNINERTFHNGQLEISCRKKGGKRTPISPKLEFLRKMPNPGILEFLDLR
jgi:hypothetical protein